MSSADRVAVVLMAYGTPASPEAIEEYYTDIRRGRPPTAEQLAELTGRYEAIGGLSPLAARTAEQRDAVQAALDDLAPHDSELSIGEYVRRVEAAVGGADVTVRSVRSWARLPEFVDFVARDLQHRLSVADGRTRVLFTAHSLPARIVDTGDPYPRELRATAEAVAGQLGLREGNDWQLAWQSAGRTPEPWLGPDITDVIRSGGLADVDTVIVSAVGFVADHLEVLYDLDLEARHLASEADLAFDRTTCVNADAAVMAGLARLIHDV